MDLLLMKHAKLCQNLINMKDDDLKKYKEAYAVYFDFIPALHNLHEKYLEEFRHRDYAKLKKNIREFLWSLKILARALGPTYNEHVENLREAKIQKRLSNRQPVKKLIKTQDLLHANIIKPKRALIDPSDQASKLIKQQARLEHLERRKQHANIIKPKKALIDPSDQASTLIKQQARLEYLERRKQAWIESKKNKK